MKLHNTLIWTLIHISLIYRNNVANCSDSQGHSESILEGGSFGNVESIASDPSDTTEITLDVKSNKSSKGKFDQSKNGKVITFTAKNDFRFNVVTFGDSEIWRTANPSEYSSKVVLVGRRLKRKRLTIFTGEGENASIKFYFKPGTNMPWSVFNNDLYLKSLDPKEYPQNIKFYSRDSDESTYFKELDSSHFKVKHYYYTSDLFVYCLNSDYKCALVKCDDKDVWNIDDRIPPPDEDPDESSDQESGDSSSMASFDSDSDADSYSVGSSIGSDFGYVYRHPVQVSYHRKANIIFVYFEEVYRAYMLLDGKWVLKLNKQIPDKTEFDYYPYTMDADYLYSGQPYYDSEEEDSEDEEEEEPSPLEPPPVHRSDIRFFTRDSKTGKRIPMDRSLYDVRHLGYKVLEYTFEPETRCAAVKHAEKTIWRHYRSEYGLNFPNQITHNKNTDKIYINFESFVFFYQRDSAGDWNNTKFDLRLYAAFPLDPSVLVELNTNHYELTRLGEDRFEFRLKGGARCSEVQCDDRVIWFRGEFGLSVPTSVAYNEALGEISVGDSTKRLFFYKVGDRWPFYGTKYAAGHARPGFSSPFSRDAPFSSSQHPSLSKVISYQTLCLAASE